MRQCFEYTMRQYVPLRSWSGWSWEGFEPSPSEFYGLLSHANEALLNDSLTNDTPPPPIVTIGAGGGSFHFREFNPDRQVWVYERCCRGCCPDRRGLAFIRQTSTMTINVEIKHTRNGNDLVSATTMGGGLIWQRAFGMHDSVRMKGVMEHVRDELQTEDRIGQWTQLTFVRGDEIINGKYLLKKGRPMEPWKKFLHSNLTFRGRLRTRNIRHYMVQKAMGL
jgi:hypothetical protein